VSKLDTVTVTITVGEHTLPHTDRPTRLSMGFAPGLPLSQLAPKDYRALQRAMETFGRVLGPLVKNGPTPSAS
jgi:hypothetical protein